MKNVEQNLPQAQKWIEDICIVADITPRQAFRAFQAKYNFRASQGNPKNKAWERVLVAKAIADIPVI